MLKQLDILIGFTVIMAVASLLITVVTQMVSAALGLRGKYLAEALDAMIHKIDPTIDEEITGLGRQLAEWILTHPVLSDSLLRTRRQKWDDWWLIGAVRKRWKIASAVRPDELFKILQDVAGAIPADALDRMQQLERIAQDAWEGIRKRGDQSRIIRSDLNAELAQLADEKRRVEYQAVREAIQAAANAKLDPAALAEWSAANLTAQTAAKARIQAVEIARKAKAAMASDKAAKHFANEISMRVAAAKVLAKLYRPEESVQPSPTETVGKLVQQLFKPANE